MAIEYKEGVPQGITSEPINIAIEKIDNQFKDYFNLRITSTSDGKHMRKSKHYDVPCNAFDMSVRPLLKYFTKAIKQILGKGYDVVLEYDPPHIHIEWDPKE